LLITANDVNADGLWADLEGRLYLWEQPERNHKPREVSFERARDWWKQFHQAETELAPPFYPEFSAANQIADLLRSKRERPANRQLELEGAIHQANALEILFEHHFLFPGDGNAYNDEIKCGFVELGATTFNRLRKASEGAFQNGGVNSRTNRN
jgi:hypothetical protein